jgi:hypothetical protein
LNEIQLDSLSPHSLSNQHHVETLARRGRIVGSNKLAGIMAVHPDNLPFDHLAACVVEVRKHNSLWHLDADCQ